MKAVTVSDTELQQRLSLGEDSAWEFKLVEFKDNRPVGPKRDDLADELAAFANADGGTLLCGVADDGLVRGMTPQQMAAVDQLLVEVSTDVVKPALRIAVHHRELDGKGFVIAEVARGDTIHERDGCAFIRVGATKRRLDGDERLRLAQNRAQSRYLWFDKQLVPQTGFETLNERLWEPLLSTAGAADPRRGLMNLRLMARDEAGLERATVAGVLLCAPCPQEWLPQAVIMATLYRGSDRASGQLDTQEITGPLGTQIADAAKFVTRNMRVAARKSPARENLPQYAEAAVFEAIVNAVAHRDYSISSRKIRLSMFRDRLEIESPGQLPNGMTIESMGASQATRNEVIASVFGRIPVGDVPGSEHRQYLMERRGDGVAIILKETREVAGNAPEYALVDDSSLVLSIPAAKLELIPADATVTVHSGGEPLPGVEILALFPNKTWLQASTDEAGEAILDLYTSHLPMTVYAAAKGFEAGLERDWIPGQRGLLLELKSFPKGGAAIFPQATGNIPGLSGRLNPKLDTHDRTYLYADNIAVEEGRQQPVPFRLGKPLKLADAYGVQMLVTIVDIVGRAALVEFQSIDT